MNRRNQVTIARMRTEASKGIEPSPEEVQYIADQAQRDAGMLPLLTSGNHVAAAAVINELQKRGTPLAKLTSQTLAMAQGAKDIIPPMQSLIYQLEDPSMEAKLGPALGRWNEFKAGRIGAGDPEYQQLRAFADLVTSGVLRAHFGARGGNSMYDKFKEQLDAGKMDAPTMIATLKAWKDFLNTAYVMPSLGVDMNAQTKKSNAPQAGAPAAVTPTPALGGGAPAGGTTTGPAAGPALPPGFRLKDPSKPYDAKTNKLVRE
jgi:hypothetical protein